jgi:crotonobetainyl-CoA:carnitine CoA-transferase CaiB-like acyl-CoA transferase
VPCSPANDLDEVLSSGLIEERGLLQTAIDPDGAVHPVVTSPLSRTWPSSGSPRVPRLGEHTEEILHSLQKAGPALAGPADAAEQKGSDAP